MTEIKKKIYRSYLRKEKITNKIETNKVFKIIEGKIEELEFLEEDFSKFKNLILKLIQRGGDYKNLHHFLIQKKLI
jgi:hypothetical protein